MKLFLGLLLLLMVQTTAMAQISYGQSAFQKQDEKATSKQKDKQESIYHDTHLDLEGVRKKRKADKRQKVVQTERRKLRFNRKGKAVKRRQRNDELLYLLEEGN